MSVGFFFSNLLGHLPVLAVLIAGFVLVATRRSRIGPRSASLAQFGLALLTLGEVLSVAWSGLLPSIFSSLNYSSARYGVLIFGVGVVFSLAFAAGIGLLIAAVLARAPAGPAFAGGGFESSGPGFAGGGPQGFGPGATQYFGDPQGFPSGDPPVQPFDGGGGSR